MAEQSLSKQQQKTKKVEIFLFIPLSNSGTRTQKSCFEYGFDRLVILFYARSIEFLLKIATETQYMEVRESGTNNVAFTQKKQIDINI